MRPKDTKKNKWLIDRDTWFPTRKEAMDYIKSRKPKLPYEIENLPYAKTPFGNYRKSTWRVRTFSPVKYMGKKVATTYMTYTRAQEVKKYHPNKKLVKIRDAYYYLE